MLQRASSRSPALPPGDALAKASQKAASGRPHDGSGGGRLVGTPPAPVPVPVPVPVLPPACDVVPALLVPPVCNGPAAPPSPTRPPAELLPPADEPPPPRA